MVHIALIENDERFLEKLIEENKDKNYTWSVFDSHIKIVEQYTSEQLVDYFFVNTDIVNNKDVLVAIKNKFPKSHIVLIYDNLNVEMLLSSLFLIMGVTTKKNLHAALDECITTVQQGIFFLNN